MNPPKIESQVALCVVAVLGFCVNMVGIAFFHQEQLCVCVSYERRTMTSLSYTALIHVVANVSDITLNGVTCSRLQRHHSLLQHVFVNVCRVESLYELSIDF